MLETFHFFTEPQIFSEDLRLSVRIRTKDKKQKEQIEEVLKQKLKKVQDLLFKETDFDREEYSGEQEKFGGDGWLITQKFFEFGSRVAIFYIKGNATIPPDGGEYFRPEHFVHYFLNQLGYTDVDTLKDDLTIRYETFLHFDRYFERMANEGKTLEQAKDIIDKLLKQGNGIGYFKNI